MHFESGRNCEGNSYLIIEYVFAICVKCHNLVAETFIALCQKCKSTKFQKIIYENHFTECLTKKFCTHKKLKS